VQETRKGKRRKEWGWETRKEGQEEIKTETKIKKRHRKACGREKRRKELRRETKKTGQEDIQSEFKNKKRNKKK
jgi:hypothetical protein